MKRPTTSNFHVAYVNLADYTFVVAQSPLGLHYLAGLHYLPGLHIGWLPVYDRETGNFYSFDCRRCISLSISAIYAQ